MPSSPKSKISPISCNFSPGSGSTTYRRTTPPGINFSPTSAVRISLESLPISGSRSSVSCLPLKNPIWTSSSPKRTCCCSPNTHPGAFRCSFHRKQSLMKQKQGVNSINLNRLSLRRSAMLNSLVRIGIVEGDLAKRTLATLIRPSSHQQRRRENFNPQPSRLSIMFNSTDP